MSRKGSFLCRSEGLFACLIVVLFLVSVSGAAAAFKNMKVGDQSLPLELKDLDGNVHSIAQMKDAKAVLVLFWATWSDRSVNEIEDLKKIHAAYGDKGLKILAVNVEKQIMASDDVTRVAAFTKEKALPFTVVVDDGLRTYNEWGVVATPTTAIVDGAGTMVFDLSSYPTAGYDEIDVAVQKALGIYVEKVPTHKKPAYTPAKEAMLHMGLGKRLIEKGFGTKAIPEFTMAAEADTHYAEPPLYLGYAFLKEGRADSAEPLFTRSLELDPSGVEARLLAAHVLNAKEKVGEALALIAAAPAEAVAAYLDTAKAAALKGEGKAAEAKAALEAALSDELKRRGFVLEAKRKMSALEKLKNMSAPGGGAP